MQKQSQTSLPASTSKEKGFVPYWNEQCQVSVSQWLSATKIDLQGSDLTLLNGSSNVREDKSWFSIESKVLPQKNSQGTCQLSSPFLRRGSTASEVIGCKKIKLYPNRTQKAILRQWMGTYRWAYNKSVQYMIEAYQEGNPTYSYMKNRKDWIARMRAEAEWVRETPPHTVYGAMMDACKDYKQHVAKLSKGLKSSTPRCKKRFQRSFYILGNSITSKGIYPRKLGFMETREGLPYKPSDSRIIYENRNWYIAIPYKRQPVNREPKGAVCAIDPGVRTFLTFFSPTKIGKIGEGAFNRIVTLAKYADDLYIRSRQVKGKKRYRMKLAWKRALKRIQRLVDELHYQAISYLLNSFDVVICPKANFTSAVKKAGRKIRSKTVRSLLTFSFARFRDRLIHKAKMYGKRVELVCESYTSKTHNITGEVIQNLGGRKFITSQGIRLDRDVNGSLGIFLKSLLDQPQNTNSVHLLNFVNEK